MGARVGIGTAVGVGVAVASVFSVAVGDSVVVGSGAAVGASACVGSGVSDRTDVDVGSAGTGVFVGGAARSPPQAAAATRTVRISTAAITAAPRPMVSPASQLITIIPALTNAGDSQLPKAVCQRDRSWPPQRWSPNPPSERWSPGLLYPRLPRPNGDLRFLPDRGTGEGG